LIENIVLNEVQHAVAATNVAITSHLGMGTLQVHALTKGGAYNQFAFDGMTSQGACEEDRRSPVRQVQLGVSLDDLLARFQCRPPTHVKIDVDGHEPEIIKGALQLLAHPSLRSVLIEVQQDDPRHLQMLERLAQLGYQCRVQRSNWESRANREREQEHPATNMIFIKAS